VSFRIAVVTAIWNCSGDNPTTTSDTLHRSVAPTLLVSIRPCSELGFCRTPPGQKPIARAISLLPGPPLRASSIILELVPSVHSLATAVELPRITFGAVNAMI
jgi:hypothetical protein